MKVTTQTRKLMFGLAALTTVPVAMFAGGCSGADEAPAPNTAAAADGDEAEATDGTGQAWATISCRPRTQRDARGWGWQQIYKGDSLRNHCGRTGSGCAPCADAPGCSSGNQGKKMKCIAVGTHNDFRVYECKRGAPSGPTPQVCTLRGGGSAADGFDGPTDPGPDGFPDSIDRSW